MGSREWVTLFGLVKRIASRHDERRATTVAPVTNSRMRTTTFYNNATILHISSIYIQAVVDGDFQEIALEDYRGKWLILFFYPLDFTFVCPTEIIAFSDRFPEFEALNAAVIACSTDSHFAHLAWTNTPRNRGGT